MWDAEQRQMCAHTIKNNVTHAMIETGLSLSVRRLQREREQDRQQAQEKAIQVQYTTVHGTLCWVCVIFPNGNAMMTGLCDDVCTRAQHQQCSASFLFFITKQQFQSSRQQQDPAPARARIARHPKLSSGHERAVMTVQTKENRRCTTLWDYISSTTKKRI